MSFNNLRELLESRVTAMPQKTWLLSATDERRWRYAEFDAAVNRTANLLLSLGICKGDKVGLLVANSPEYIIAYFACWKIGAVAGPINSHLKSKGLAFVLDNSDAVLLITESGFLDRIAPIRQSLPHLRQIIVTDKETDETIHFQTAIAVQSPELRSVQLDAHDEAIIIYTSGTTGRPKGVLLTHRNLIANAQQITDWMKFTETDQLLCIMPLFHVNGIIVTTMVPLYAGASTVVAPRFSVRRHWQWISDFRITSFGSVATMLVMLTNTYPDGVPAGLHTKQLRFAMCGSAPVPVEVMKQFEERFNCLVIEGYGLSESTCRASFNPPDGRRRPGSCGLPIGNELKIFDEHDHELGVDQVGEVVLRGDNLLKGYFKNPEATAKAFRSGWFHTGDVGYRDAEGFLFLVDRKSDMIIRGGENIYPREIDEILYRHPAVQDAATIGVKDPLYGEEVKAFVVLKNGAQVSGEELIAFCRAQLADFKCPKTIEFLEAIPKGPTGKLLKRRLSPVGGPKMAKQA